MYKSFRSVSFFVLIFVIFPAIHSCDSKRFYEENKSIEKFTWNVRNKAIFMVPIQDTGHLYSFYINIRNSTDYPYSNIYLFLKTVFPDGKIARDTIECQLADYDGKWRGSGISNIKFNRFLFQRGIKFSQQGQYLFEIEQAMRIPDLKGIIDIGIRLEKE